MSSQANGHDVELPPLVRPDNREVPATQQLLDALWAWYQALVKINNAVSGQGLAHGRKLRLLSIWPSDDGKLFTASIRARDRSRGDREFVLYSTSATPAMALQAVVDAAKDPGVAWKEQIRKAAPEAAGSNGSLPEVM